jgi:hypothetical protein
VSSTSVRRSCRKLRSPTENSSLRSPNRQHEAYRKYLQVVIHSLQTRISYILEAYFNIDCNTEKRDNMQRVCVTFRSCNKCLNNARNFSRILRVPRDVRIESNKCGSILTDRKARLVRTSAPFCTDGFALFDLSRTRSSSVAMLPRSGLHETEAVKCGLCSSATE